MTNEDESHLAQAIRHVAEGEQRVANQRALIARLAADDHNTTQAQDLLQTLLQTLHEMRKHLQMELGEQFESHHL